ncbi:hypothetical protein Lal_00029115 [Lupinus albus]|nr:hypothetical protein Lal_00029115 [Lupinus albus]
MEVPKDEAASGGNPNSNSNPNSVNDIRERGGSKGKSCKGCAYYSSLHKAKSINPTCLGFSTTLPQVPPYVVGETELEASKEGRTLTNFKYACIGYSVYIDNKDSSADTKDKTAQLPFCVGLEAYLAPWDSLGYILYDLELYISWNKYRSVMGPNVKFVKPLKIKRKKECRCGRKLVQVVLEEKSSTSPVGHVPAHKTEEHEHATPQPRRFKPPSSIPEEFLNRQAEVFSLDLLAPVLET